MTDKVKPSQAFMELAEVLGPEGVARLETTDDTPAQQTECPICHKLTCPEGRPCCMPCLPVWLGEASAAQQAHTPAPDLAEKVAQLEREKADLLAAQAHFNKFLGDVMLAVCGRGGRFQDEIIAEAKHLRKLADQGQETLTQLWEVEKEKADLLESLQANAERHATITDGTRTTSGEGWRLWCEEAEAERDRLLEVLKLAEQNLTGCINEDDIPSFVIRDKARAAIARAGGQV